MSARPVETLKGGDRLEDGREVFDTYPAGFAATVLRTITPTGVRSERLADGTILHTIG